MNDHTRLQIAVALKVDIDKVEVELDGVHKLKAMDNLTVGAERAQSAKRAQSAEGARARSAQAARAARAQGSAVGRGQRPKPREKRGKRERRR